MRYDWQFKDGRTIAKGSPWGPKWLVGLLGVHYFDSVTMVQYYPKKATDAEMVRLGNLTRVDTLAFGPTEVSDAGLAHLDRLTRLRWLTISGRPPRSTDKLLGQLKVLTRLQGLNLDDSDVTDAGLRHLEGLTNLELLGLGGTGVTDAGLKHLQGLTALQHLYLNGTQISDEGLANVKRLGQPEEACDQGHEGQWNRGERASEGATNRARIPLSYQSFTAKRFSPIPFIAP